MEQVKMSDKPESPGWISRGLFFLAGTDSSIMARVLPEDRTPFIWVGVINILLSSIIAFGVAGAPSSLFAFSVGNIVGIVICLVMGVVYCVLLATINFRFNTIFYRKRTAWQYISLVIGMAMIVIIMTVVSIPVARLIYARVNLNPTRLSLTTLEGLTILLLNMLWINGIIILYINRHGFYFQLMQEIQNLQTQNRPYIRQEVLANLRDENAIKQTREQLKRISLEENSTDNDYLQHYIGQLDNTQDPKALATLGFLALKSGDYERALEYYERAIAKTPDDPETWKKKAEVHAAMGDSISYGKDMLQAAELEKKELFKKNLSDKIVLLRVECQGISFYGKIDWPLKNNINILLGRNGYGKSHLMTIMLAMLQEQDKMLQPFAVNEDSICRIHYQSDRLSDLATRTTIEQKIIDVQQQLEKLSGSADTVQQIQELIETLQALNLDLEKTVGKGDLTYTRSGIRNKQGKIPVLAIPDLRFLNKATTVTSNVVEERARNLLENSATHFIEQAPYENVIHYFLNIVCGIHMQKQKFDDELFLLINRVFRRLTGNDFIWDSIRPSDDGAGYVILVKTEGSPQPLPIQKVSQGTLSVLAVIGTIFQYLAVRYPQVPRNLIGRQPALVWIDELDAHLHPLWQQKIIGILRQEFPGVQFLISAHSPLLVAGCREGEVSILRKSTDGFSIRIMEQHFIGASLLDIFRRVFEIEEVDETFSNITALMPFRETIKEKVNQLSSRKETLSLIEQAELDKLTSQMDYFIYFDHVQEQRDKVVDYDQLNKQITSLERENVYLKKQLYDGTKNALK